MAIASTRFNTAAEVEQFIDEEMKRSGWTLSDQGVDRTRGDCIENAGIKRVDWTTNTVYFSVYAPEFDY